MENRNIALLVVFGVIVLAYFFHRYPQGMNKPMAGFSAESTSSVLLGEGSDLSYNDRGKGIAFTYASSSIVSNDESGERIKIMDRNKPSLLVATLTIHNGYESYEWKNTTMNVFAVDKETKEWKYTNKDSGEELPSLFIGYTASTDSVYKFITGAAGENKVAYVVPQKQKNRVVVVELGWSEANEGYMTETARFSADIEKTILSIK